MVAVLVTAACFMTLFVDVLVKVDFVGEDKVGALVVVRALVFDLLDWLRSEVPAFPIPLPPIPPPVPATPVFD